jgi:hypothetical protein
MLPRVPARVSCLLCKTTFKDEASLRKHVVRHRIQDVYEAKNMAVREREIPLPLSTYCTSKERVVAEEIQLAKSTMLRTGPQLSSLTPAKLQGASRSPFKHGAKIVAVGKLTYVQLQPVALQEGDSMLDDLQWPAVSATKCVCFFFDCLLVISHHITSFTIQGYCSSEGVPFYLQGSTVSHPWLDFGWRYAASRCTTGKTGVQVQGPQWMWQAMRSPHRTVYLQFQSPGVACVAVRSQCRGVPSLCSLCMWRSHYEKL